MSLELTIVMLIASWLAVASAMLWGVMRVSRRYHPRGVEPSAPQRPVVAKPVKAQAAVIS
ncbi:hypothetical protein [Pseudomonas syringae group genomosp. 3]|uniref:Uncharacterized protein n=1 Tax=Pseudomonas syringae pv. coriandricola TaxID=264453 RepID=A0A3M4UAG4_9PSED|nr:hypothetical protein [Pseudomonas syringae group genomosp. 3]KPW60836.1 Uncharacterized protein ALO86_03996 [Pseudomonas syringae pv. berberidis]KPY12975.1 Uncharacterized protein ALO54_03781 [Pseudomonas syringae pv. philadelphi]RMM17703.1 hypothetical protein ALQ83_02219 [Pseudomonas syringae pv. berberidis]RMP65510.1 hypothetical protein ALQ19_00415 [Pseudomonas syringae pv. berberidis]RMQ39282.1 hypothetical protein ALQ06_02675 [Pseudomonas syringae pv. berberidis]